jgi:hypothetical protein
MSTYGTSNTTASSEYLWISATAHNITASREDVWVVVLASKSSTPGHREVRIQLFTGVFEVRLFSNEQDEQRYTYILLFCEPHTIHLALRAIPKKSIANLQFQLFSSPRSQQFSTHVRDGPVPQSWVMAAPGPSRIVAKFTTSLSQGS